MAEYNKKCYKNFQSIALPPTYLLKKNTRFRWTSGCQKVFKWLLSPSSVLKAHNFGQLYFLAMSASTVLLQLDKDKKLYHATHFKKFHQFHKSYSTIEKEALALLSKL